MRFLIQRVINASVSVEGSTVGSIDKGLLVFIGIHKNDSYEIADKMINKLFGLRIFEDEAGKTNLNMNSVNGELLLISQFTLYADCRKGNRPSFTDAAPGTQANGIYEYIIEKCKQSGFKVEKGIFGADMKVSLINDGPFTVLIDSNDIVKA